MINIYGMGDNMTVSVIVPVYNGERYIDKCIDSILSQSYSSLEIIIINDGSNDKTDEIIKSYLEKDFRIKYITQNNRGVSYSRNQGIEISYGEYVTFVDSDDTVESEYINYLVKSVTENDSDIAVCGYIDISEYGVINLNDFYNGSSILQKDEFISRIFKGVGGTLWGKIFRNDIIKANNIKMNPDIYMCEDMLFVLEYVMKCRGFGTIEESLYNYNRTNESSISSRINFNYFNNMIEVMNEIKSILIFNGYSEGYIDSILCERTKNLVFSFSIMQHNRKHGYRRQEKIRNFKYMFSENYFKKYKGMFQTNNMNEKILKYLLNSENIKMVCGFSHCIYGINKLKYNIKKRLNLIGG
ncbi:glycosyltransferase [Clostridium sp.]|uniref:glycosyltransferase family 2 protein n=2 Tax=Clostridium sp. TaxID=1506 RepID=UPI003216B64D